MVELGYSRGSYPKKIDSVIKKIVQSVPSCFGLQRLLTPRGLLFLVLSLDEICRLHKLIFDPRNTSKFQRSYRDKNHHNDLRLNLDPALRPSSRQMMVRLEKKAVRFVSFLHDLCTNISFIFSAFLKLAPSSTFRRSPMPQRPVQ